MARYFAISARGIETVTAGELKRLGASDATESFGGVFFEGDLEILYKANLWSRTASRILMPLKEFAAKTPEMLYDQVRRIKWDQYLDEETTFAVDCTIAGAKSLKPNPRGPRPRPGDSPGINHSHYAALKIKDAIVDQQRSKQGVRANVDTERPDIRVVAYLREGRCILSLDASGASLHERGYRLKGGQAPLKETLAAAILELSGWDPLKPFLDPMCGSGTLVLEAGLKSLNIAPGLFREHWGFFGWPDFDQGLWDRVVEEARGQVKQRPAAPVLGFDQDRQAIATALENSKRAGLTRAVHFERREFSALEPVGSAPGTIIVNPPYGERIGELARLEETYELIGDLFKQRMKGWTGFVFTGNLELAKKIGLRASRRIELFNGAIECRLLKFELY